MICSSLYKTVFDHLLIIYFLQQRYDTKHAITLFGIVFLKAEFDLDISKYIARHGQNIASC